MLRLVQKKYRTRSGALHLASSFFYKLDMTSVCTPSPCWWARPTPGRAASLQSSSRRSGRGVAKCAPDDVFVLDFDGVCCDSGGEVMSAGLAVARERWPESFAGVIEDDVLESEFVRELSALSGGPSFSRLQLRDLNGEPVSLAVLLIVLKLQRNFRARRERRLAAKNKNPWSDAIAHCNRALDLDKQNSTALRRSPFFQIVAFWS